METFLLKQSNKDWLISHSKTVRSAHFRTDKCRPCFFISLANLLHGEVNSINSFIQWCSHKLITLLEWDTQLSAAFRTPNFGFPSCWEHRWGFGQSTAVAYVGPRMLIRILSWIWPADYSIRTSVNERVPFKWLDHRAALGALEALSMLKQ